MTRLKSILQLFLIGLVALMVGVMASVAQAARIKDVATMEGVRPNQLIGYGLVVGLNGTGDKAATRFTVQSVMNMLERLGVHIDATSIQIKNVAAVVVTAELPAFAKAGSQLDVLVSSLGDASSLSGGTLLLTPLKGVDGQIYALAQGPLLVGGFAVTGEAATTAKNHPTVGRIPQGGTVEREIEYDINDLASIKITLDKPDFITATRMVKAINGYLGGQYAAARDAATVDLKVPPKDTGNLVGLLAQVEQLDIQPDVAAKVIIDERTGTIVMGDKVRLSRVAVAHGNLSIQIRENQEVSQPLPFSEGGQTVVTPDTQIQVQEEERKLMLLQPGVTIGSVVSALNAIGATPRDLIAILQSLKAAGALHAELVVI